MDKSLLAELGDRITQQVPMELTEAVAIEDLSGLIDELHSSPAYHSERLIIEFSIKLSELMARNHVGRKELAKRLGRSSLWVHGLMAGSRQTKIRHMVEALMALGYRMKLDIVPVTDPHHYDEPTEIIPII